MHFKMSVKMYRVTARTENILVQEYTHSNLFQAMKCLNTTVDTKNLWKTYKALFLIQNDHTLLTTFGQIQYNDFHMGSSIARRQTDCPFLS